ncbi:MAG: DUF4907 domain-containing protein [Ferruginibacter sp.]|nr:DUF4907 domain-containing protein [Ferruginibacter sp.]
MCTAGITIALSLAIYSCHNGSSSKPAGENKAPANIIAATFKTADGWGYTVYVNDKIFIKQSLIPVIEGNKSFANQEDANKLATLVVNKLKHQEKPIIRLDELQQLGIVAK